MTQESSSVTTLDAQDSDDDSPIVNDTFPNEDLPGTDGNDDARQSSSVEPPKAQGSMRDKLESKTQTEPLIDTVPRKQGGQVGITPKRYTADEIYQLQKLAIRTMDKSTTDVTKFYKNSKNHKKLMDSGRTYRSLSTKINDVRNDLLADPDKLQAIRDRMQREKEERAKKAQDKVQKEMEKSKKQAEETGETLDESIKKRNKK